MVFRVQQSETDQLRVWLNTQAVNYGFSRTVNLILKSGLKVDQRTLKKFIRNEANTPSKIKQIFTHLNEVFPSRPWTTTAETVDGLFWQFLANRRIPIGEKVGQAANAVFPLPPHPQPVSESEANAPFPPYDSYRVPIPPRIPFPHF